VHMKQLALVSKGFFVYRVKLERDSGIKQLYSLRGTSFYDMPIL